MNEKPPFALGESGPAAVGKDSLSHQRLWSLSRVEWSQPRGQGVLTVRLWDNQRWETRDYEREWLGARLFGGPTATAVVPEVPLLFSLHSSPVSVAPLQLREQTSYRIEVSWEGEREPPSLDCFPALSPPILRPDPGWRRPNVFSGTLNFRDYVGETALVLRDGGHEFFRVVLEVRSRKMDYLDDFVALLDSLGERMVSSLLRLHSPVYASFLGHSGAQASVGDELFLLLRYLVRWPPLQRAWERLRRASPQHLQQVRRLVSVERHPPQRGQDLWEGYQRKNSWAEAPSGWTLPTPAQGRIPQHYPRRGLQVGWNSPENRFVKQLHERVSGVLDALSVRYERAGRLSLREELRSLREEWMNVPPWMIQIPLASGSPAIPRRSLASQELYQPFLKAWDLLSASLQLSWAGLADAIQGPLRDLARLYEYWCFFELWEALCAVAEPEASNPPWWTFDSEGLRADLRPGVGFPLRYQHLHLKLFYQRRFVPGEANMRSYSVPLVPDYTLEVRAPQGEPVLLCFDAKYRSERALEKMHAYRDALRGALGCYLFYPGRAEHPTIFARNPETLLPGVGAFALRPDLESREWLARFLSWGLEQIASENAESS